MVSVQKTQVLEKYTSAAVTFTSSAKFLLVGVEALLLAGMCGCGSFFLPNQPPSNAPRFAYVANYSGGTAGSVSAFTVGSGGALSSAGVFPTGAGPQSVRADTLGQFLYTANADGSVSAFLVDRNSGKLNAVAGNFMAGTDPSAIAVDPAARALYVANRGSNNISGFAVNSATGALAPAPNSPFAATGGPLRINIDPAGRFVYAAEGSAGIDVYVITTGLALLRQQNVPAASGASTSDVLIEPRAKFAYVADGVRGVAAYSVDSATGKLAAIPGAAVTSGAAPVALAVDPLGLYLFVANRDSNDVATFSINQADGRLASLGENAAAGPAPADLAVDPSGKFLYVANFGGGVQVFAISGGPLSPVSSTTAGQNPSSITVIP